MRSNQELFAGQAPRLKIWHAIVALAFMAWAIYYVANCIVEALVPMVVLI